MILTSLDKHLAILDVLAAHPKGLSLSSLSSITQQPKSTLHHALNTFKSRDFVAQDPETKKYSLGFKFLSLSRVLLNHFDIRNIAKPEIEKLNQITQEMVVLSILREKKAVYIDKVQTAHKIYQDIEVGYTAPAHTCTSGKALLSGLTQLELEELYPSETILFQRETTQLATPIPDHLVEDRDELFYELDIARQQGYYYGEELYYRGVRAIAAPIFMDRKVACAICVTGSVYSMTPEKIANVIIPNLLETVKNLSKIFTY